MDKSQLLSVREAAVLKGCTLTYIRQLLWAERLPGAYKEGKVWKIPRVAIEALL